MVIETLHIVIEKLNAIEVPYMLLGSVAMSFYTVSRVTQDIDMVVVLKLDQVDKMEQIFAGDYFDKETVIFEVKRGGMFNVILSSNSFKIDFILVKYSRYSKLAFERRRLIYDYEKPIYIVSIEDLIIAKLSWIQQLFSERQVRDIKNLIIANQWEKEYITHWIKELELKTFGLFEM